MTLLTGLKTKLIALILMVGVAAGFGGFIYFMPNNHNLIILNRTGEDVVVSAVRINNKDFGSHNVVLKSVEPKERRDNPAKYLDYSFKAARDSILVVDIKDRNNKSIRMSCKLIDQSRAGCVHYASIRDAGNLTCICDSNADFND
ncbi:MAG: hypothetical protein ABWU16_07120 [Halothiobacillaceae bacterium]